MCYFLPWSSDDSKFVEFRLFLTVLTPAVAPALTPGEIWLRLSFIMFPQVPAVQQASLREAVAHRGLSSSALELHEVKYDTRNQQMRFKKEVEDQEVANFPRQEKASSRWTYRHWEEARPVWRLPWWQTCVWRHCVTMPQVKETYQSEADCGGKEANIRTIKWAGKSESCILKRMHDVLLFS